VTSGAAASRYARALFDVTLKEGADVEKVQRELDEFVSLFRSHEVLSQTLGNPAIPASKKVAVVKALLDRAGSVSPTLAKLMLLLAERDRLVLLPDVLRTYRERLMDHQKVIRGEVTTAMALPADKLRALEQGLQRATGRTVVLESKVDPSIIGGVITRLGSTVYDGSVTTQLQKMKEALVEAGQ
jgi:F-type H+-transporting ATPase subunit delta